MVAVEIEEDFKKQGEIVIERFEQWAETAGDRTFFYYGEEDRGLSYKEFNQYANTIAHNLKAMGIQKGDRISLFLKNQLATTLAMFGIWKIGAIYCPINFNYLGRLLAFHINDTNPKVLVIEQGLVPAINQIKSAINSLDVILYSPQKGDHDYKDVPDVKVDSKFPVMRFDDLLHGDVSNPSISIAHKDVANIIYTSGTTGNPKGVMQSHRWMHNYVYLPLKATGPDTTIYNDLPLYHVGGAIQNVVKAAWGGCKIAAWDRFSPRHYWDRVRKSGATSSIMLDVMVPWLMAQEPSSQDVDNPLTIINMQPLPANHHEFTQRFGIRFVTVGYGSTEAGAVFGAIIDETGKLEESLPLAEAIGVPVVSGSGKIKKGFMGKPIELHEVAILDDDDHEVDPGQPGQLAIRSKLPNLLFSEYFNNSEDTQRAFRNGWYHTGDIICRDKGGFFYFVDRVSGFLRVRGENVAASQVEDLIKAHPQIANCAVFGVPAAVGSEDDIVACIVLKAGENIAEETLMAWIRNEMPKFMWPRLIKFLADLPVTPTFKVEKYKLKEKLREELNL